MGELPYHTKYGTRQEAEEAVERAMDYAYREEQARIARGPLSAPRRES